jgi:hypothetical protein
MGIVHFLIDPKDRLSEVRESSAADMHHVTLIRLIIACDKRLIKFRFILTLTDTFERSIGECASSAISPKQSALLNVWTLPEYEI